MVVYFCHQLSDSCDDLSDVYVVLSDIYVDLSDIMSTCQIILLLSLWYYWARARF